MIRMLRIILTTLLAVLAVLVLAIGTLAVGLNTQGGRDYAVREINRLAGPMVKLSGLGGHFPADIKLRDVQVADASGVWLHATGLELRWRPQEILRLHVHVTALTATQIDMLRSPAASGKKSSGGGTMPPVTVTIDHVAIDTLTLAPAVTGQAIALHVQAAGRLQSQTQGDVQLDAMTPDGASIYHLNGALDGHDVNMALHVAEPPGGLLGHYAGPQAQGPFSADIALAGPQDNAALRFALGLGAARLDGAGQIGIVPAHLFADVMLTVPELAPFASMAKANFGGSTQLHLRVAQGAHGAATLAMDGELALRQAPPPVQKLLGAKTVMALRLSLLGDDITLDELQLHGAYIATEASGKIGQSEVSLTTSTMIDELAALTPDLAGSIMERSTVSGTKQDFALQTQLSGTVKAKGQGSDPFSIDLNVQHLPSRPTGTLTGRGKLANKPLLLDASFLREAGGGFQMEIGQTKWRTVDVAADLHLAPGEMIPSGTAKVSIGDLQDFATFVPMDVHGGVSGDFAYSSGQDIRLNLAAKNLLVNPALGNINGTLAASGTLQALGVKLQMALADLSGHPAQLALAGTLNIPARSAKLASLSADWHGLKTALQGPASVETKPSVTVHTLRLALNGGTVALDGAVWPQLNATASLQNLPLSIANEFAANLGAQGVINADATLKGPPATPAGQVTLHATGLHMRQGAADALPPANLSATAALTGNAGNVKILLNAGPDIALDVEGSAPFSADGTMRLQTVGRVDLRLLNLILSAGGTQVHGELKTNVLISGTPRTPQAAGTITLDGGSVQNIGSGLNLTKISALIEAQGQSLTLQRFSATAGQGTITGQGTLGLEGDMPVDLALNASAASPVISDLVTEALDASVTLKGAVRGPLALAGTIDIDKAEINIPHGLPPNIANLPIINEGETPPPPPAPPPPISLSLDIRAKSHIFIRGDGLFAELGGHIRLGGTLAAPDPQGRFTMVRGNFNLAGKSLRFTSGSIGFSGNGFEPTLNLVASASSAQVSDASLTVGGTASKPTVTLSSTPPLPSDEVLAQLLFGQSASSLTPFQAASLAAALAQISGVGGGLANPLDKVRSALGLDELSLGGTGSGPPTLQAGRYVAPGVYVGASQSADGQGTSVDVQVNLYKGLKLETSTGTSSTGGDSNSVGLTYQFNY
jgi:translocation and assembly module TamB